MNYSLEYVKSWGALCCIWCTQCPSHGLITTIHAALPLIFLDSESMKDYLSLTQIHRYTSSIFSVWLLLVALLLARCEQRVGDYPKQMRSRCAYPVMMMKRPGNNAARCSDLSARSWEPGTGSISGVFGGSGLSREFIKFKLASSFEDSHTAWSEKETAGD